ncbi:MAG: DUF2723 domain-containing protein [Rikenellaceae bacterium]
MNYFKKSTLIFGWVAFAVSLLVYLLTLEPTASLWDCSEFIATSYKMEVGHPPGAPLFMMINRIFTIFAPSTASVALMVNVASAVASAFTIAFLFWTIAHLGRRILAKTEDELSTGEVWAIVGAGLVGSLAYAFTDTFWFSAVEGEVYAQSSLFTAIVFWAILKWENVATEPGANRWLVFTAYMMGLSIGVHLLNLLAIPAIVFVYYYRFNTKRSKKGWIKAFLVSVVILAGVLYVLIPQTVAIGAWVDRVFVNTFGLRPNFGLLTFFVGLLGALSYGIWQTHKKKKPILNTILLGVTMIVLGYSSYASVIIRAMENPPMNSNAPSDPYQLLSFLNREQYGDRPLVTGHTYATDPIEYETSTSYYYSAKEGKYLPYEVNSVKYDDKVKMFFPRMYSSASSHVDAYKAWANIKGKKVRNSAGEIVVAPTFAENLRFFFAYQVNYMYWRYFLWNFVGRQNDIQGNGEITKGNWLSGINFIDEIYLGPQDDLPAKFGENKGRNRYYFLPFILGILGLMGQYQKDRNNFTVVFWLFFMTGIAIILYLNQTPGQPRERDYAYAGSFYAFSIWIGLGVMYLYHLAKMKLNVKQAAIVATVVGFTVPTILIAENWDDHTRAGRYVARDFGYNYLNSTLPNSIIMPYGDNDTFPLWYIQEVEEEREDVKIMNLSYLAADWYTNQMKYKTNDADPVPLTLPKEKYYKKNDYIPVFDLREEPMTPREIIDFIINDSPEKTAMLARAGGQFTEYVPTKKIAIPVNKENAIKSGIVKPEDYDLMVDTIHLTISSSGLSRTQYVILDMIATTDWTRPIYVTQPFSLAETGNFADYLQLDGFSYRFVPIHTPSSTLQTGRIDSDYLYNKLVNEFRYGNIKDEKVNVDYFVDYSFGAVQIRNTFGRLAKQLVKEGDVERAKIAIDKVLEEVPFSQIAYSYNDYFLIEAMYETGQVDLADKHLNAFKEDVLSNLTYFVRFTDDKAKGISTDINYAFYNLQSLWQIAKRYGNTSIADEIETYIGKE